MCCLFVHHNHILTPWLRVARLPNLQEFTAPPPSRPSFAATAASSLNNRSFPPHTKSRVVLSLPPPHLTTAQEVALAAENKRIFSPLGGPLPAPQVEAGGSDWALDVVVKGEEGGVFVVQLGHCVARLQRVSSRQCEHRSQVNRGSHPRHHGHAGVLAP